MLPFNFKLYIYAALFVGLIAFILRYDYVVEKSERLEKENAQWAENAAKTAKQLKDAELARTDYLNKIEAGQNEINSLRDRVNAGSTVLRVNASCPKVPAIATDTAGAIAASPELTEDARQAYYSHRENIRTVEARYAYCVQTLKDERK